MSEREYPTLDTPIDEEMEVERFQLELSPDRKSVTSRAVKETVKVKTIYSKKKLYSSICPNYHHNFIVPSIHDWTAVCTQCPKRFYLNPMSETVRDGKIVSRKSGQQIK